jgi:hypothetical protein
MGTIYNSRDQRRSAKMHTTWGSIRRTASVGILCLALVSEGCISPTEYARPGADSQQLKADTRGCAVASPVVAGVLTGGAFGALAGGGLSATGSDAGAAVAVGLLVAAAFGVVAGLMTSPDVVEYDRCMQAKGYHPVSDAASPRAWRSSPAFA